MRKLIALMSLLLFCASPLMASGEDAGDLRLQITLTRGERSRDSNSATTVITIDGERLSYRKTFGGRLRGRAPEAKELKLTVAEQRKLIELIKDRRLLRTDSIEREETVSGVYLYFELSLKTVVAGKEGLIRLKGSGKSNALKNEDLYKDAAALLQEVYGIIRRADENIFYEPLIL